LFKWIPLRSEAQAWCQRHPSDSDGRGEHEKPQTPAIASGRGVFGLHWNSIAGHSPGSARSRSVWNVLDGDAPRFLGAAPSVCSPGPMIATLAGSTTEQLYQACHPFLALPAAPATPDNPPASARPASSLTWDRPTTARLPSLFGAVVVLGFEGNDPQRGPGSSVFPVRGRLLPPCAASQLLVISRCSSMAIRAWCISARCAGSVADCSPSRHAWRPRIL